MKRINVVLCFLLLQSLVLTVGAQNTVTTAGGNPSGSNGSVSFTLGQIAGNTLSGTNGTIAQGVQQPYEISVLTALESAGDFTLESIVYPNPTRGLINLIIESSGDEDLRFRLYDTNGVLLQEQKIESRETEITLQNVSSVYFLKLIKNNKEVKVFKIVRN